MNDKLIVLTIINGWIDTQHTRPKYVTMGHYDGMNIDNVEAPAGKARSVLENMFHQKEALADTSVVRSYIYALHIEPEATEGTHYSCDLSDTDIDTYTFAVTVNFRAVPAGETDKGIQRLKKRVQRISEYFESNWKAYINRRRESGDLLSNIEEVKFSYSFYYPLDSGDLLILFNSNSFTLGQTLLKHMFNSPKLEIIYSYTVLSLKQQDEKSFRQAALEEKLSYAFIYFSITDFKKFQSFAVELCKRIDPTAATPTLRYLNLLGSYDAELVFKDIKTKDFFSLCLENGLLGNSALREGVIYRSQTRIGVFSSVPQNEIAELASWKTAAAPDEYNNPLKTQYDSTEIYLKSGISEQSFPARNAFLRTLDEVYHTLCSYDNKSVNNYLYCSIVPSFGMFLVELRKIAFTHDLSEKKNMNFMYDYLNSVNSLIQSYTNSDRKLFQEPKKEQAMFDIPNKLGCFYSAAAYKIQNILRQVEDCIEKGCPSYKYTILFRPVIHNTLQTFASFEGTMPPHNQILVIETPEISMFHPRTFIAQLIHEIAHYEGNALRNRKVRREKTIDIICILIKKYIQFSLTHAKDVTAETDWGAYLSLCEQEINRAVHSSLEELEKRMADGYECADYAHYLQQNLSYTLTQLCLRELAEDTITQSLLMKALSCEDSLDKAYNAAQTFSIYMKRSMSGLIEEYLTVNYADTILNIFSELFSDLILILFLDIDPAEYLRLHKYDRTADGPLNIMSYVTDIMLLSLEGYFANSPWKLKAYEEVLSDRDYQRISVLLGKTPELKIEGQEITKDLQFFYTPSIWQAYAEYIHVCTDMFAKAVRNCSLLKQEIEGIRRLYNQVSQDSSLFIEESENLLEWYLNYSRQEELWGV